MSASTPPQERRTFRRIKTDQICRLLYRGKEYGCVVIDISEGGAALEVTIRPAIGDWVVLYFDDMGRVKAQVARHLDTGCAVAFSVTQVKRDRVVERLSILVDNGRTQSLPQERLLLELLETADGVSLAIPADDGGMLARTLSILERKGLIASTPADDGKRRFEITRTGRRERQAAHAQRST